MSHDADLAQKDLIKETRGKFEIEKLHKKLEKLSEKFDRMDLAMRDMAQDIKAIKNSLVGR